MIIYAVLFHVPNEKKLAYLRSTLISLHYIYLNFELEDSNHQTN